MIGLRERTARKLRREVQERDDISQILPRTKQQVIGMRNVEMDANRDHWTLESQ
jgi:hypothetical protein